MENKQTAVQWLFEQVENLDWKNLQGEKKTEILHQAKEMEKEQQKLFFDCGRQYQLTGEGTFTQVHNETFKSEDNE